MKVGAKVIWDLHQLFPKQLATRMLKDFNIYIYMSTRLIIYIYMSTRLINVTSLRLNFPPFLASFSGKVAENSKSDLGCMSTISKRTYHKDVKSEKILKYVYQLNKYNVLKLNFSPF